MDDDNALARLKWPIDLLVRWRYLAADDHAHCRLSIPAQVGERNFGSGSASSS